MAAAATADRLSVRRLAGMGRRDLVETLARAKELKHEWIRRMVLKEHRRDILAACVLGYQVEPHHLKIQQHTHRYRKGLVLVWRGAGKSTVGTVVECIFQLLLNRDRRILLASKTAQNAEGFLTEIKGHFESNEVLREIFGDYVGTEKWGNDAITVSGRSKPFKEPSINTVGIGGAVASKHYDIIIADDLVDEENSRTKHQRELMLNWYYKVLLPTLEPPDANDRFIGCLWLRGTRYHYEDLYGHLTTKQPDGTGGEMSHCTLVIPIEDEHGNPAWPAKFPAEHIAELKQAGLIRFNSQYLCNCDAMKGSIFSYDDCQVLTPAEVPNIETLLLYHGVDLAISEDETNDMFAQVMIGIDTTPAALVTVLAYEERQLKFNAQTAAIKRMARTWKPVRTGIEANAYQKAQIDNLLHEDHKEHCEYKLNIVPIYTLKDKESRAKVLSGQLFETGRIRFMPGMMKLIEHLVLFPGFRLKDLFDALEIAYATSKKRKRKSRAKEPGLL